MLDQRQAAPAAEGSTTQTLDQDEQMRRLRQTLLDVERERDTLRLGIQTRQQIGFITGVLAQRYGLQPDVAWELLGHISQDLNVKARRVAEVLLDVYCGHLSVQDADLAASIARLLPPSAAPELSADVQT